MCRYPACTTRKQSDHIRDSLGGNGITKSSASTSRDENGGREKYSNLKRCNLDSGVDGVAYVVRLGLPGAVPYRRDLGAGVEHEVPRHLLRLTLRTRTDTLTRTPAAWSR